MMLKRKYYEMKFLSFIDSIKGDGDTPCERPTPGQGPQTGPKGVIEDWRRFKQLETEKRQENERERLALGIFIN